MAGDDRVLEDLSLHILGKLRPDVRHGLSQNRDEAGIGIRRELRHGVPFLARVLTRRRSVDSARIPPNPDGGPAVPSWGRCLELAPLSGCCSAIMRRAGQ